MTIKDGGPAYPLQYDPFIDHPSHGRIHRSAIGEEVQEGMSLRDYFAGQVLAGLMACPHAYEGMTWADVVSHSWQAADAMIIERDRDNG